MKKPLILFLLGTLAGTTAAAENFLTRGIQISTQLRTPQFTQVSDMFLLNRNVKLTFSYKIGKMALAAPEGQVREK